MSGGNAPRSALQRRGALRAQPAGTVGCAGVRERAFTLIELMIVLAVVAILVAIAYPSYLKQIIKSSRAAAQSQLLELANREEKIFLNSNPGSYTADISAAYNGQSTGGLGVSTPQCGSGTSRTDDCKYDLTVTNPTTTSFVITATPASGSTQVPDGWIKIDQSGQRTSEKNGNW
jgi:type IV pilus assembly protein PilE